LLCLAEGLLSKLLLFFKSNTTVFSDGTLNPNGIRFGSAEIYSVVDQFKGEILDSLCVAQRNPTTGDERVVLFLKVS
jgi:acyl-coenzyme A synthetase/AMP-(fatty) acid ligase